jgi:hypothetical protein
MGAHPRPSDFEVHRDGRIVIADPNESALFRCTPPSGPCERIDVALKSLPGQEVLPLNAAKLHIDERAGRYYVSDNSGQRIVIADFSGRVLDASRPRIVWYPNHLAVDSEGELTVVDTNHRRLATFDVSGDRVGKILRQMSTAADAVARPGRHWPFDSIRMQDGRTWVLIARERMRDADLVIFDAGGKPSARVDLGADSDPFDIEPWRGRVWIADATNYRFESVAADGSDRREIEDREFRDELAQAREVPRRWKAIRLAAQVGAAIVVLLGIALLWRLGLLRSPRAAVPRPEDAMSPGAMSVMRIAIGVAMVIAVLAIGWKIFRLL